MMRYIASALAAWLLLACVALNAQMLPMVGGSAGIGAPVGNGTRTISGVVSSCNVTTLAATVLGELLLASVQVVSNSPTNVTVSSVNDGTNAYTLAKRIQDASNIYNNELWYKANAAAVGSSATITITFSATTNNNGCAAQAAHAKGYSATPLDVTASQSATTATPSVTTATLAQAAELAYGSSYITSTGSTPYTEASGFTNISNALAVGNGNGNVSNAYRLTAATTAVTYAPTWNALNLTNTLIATFKGGP